MKVYERLAHAFVAEGCGSLFGMMGDANMFWLDQMHQLGVRVHEVRHEGAAVGMADGFARVNQQPGVAYTTCGPGLTQIATALVTAARARSQVVVFAGEHPVADPEYSQHFDPGPFAAACEAGFVRMSHADLADEVVAKAFHMARTQNRPVVLSVPMDLQQQKWEDDEDAYVPSTAKITRSVVQPDPALIERAVGMIAAAKKPVIIMGRGAQWANAGAACVQLAERTGALLATSMLARNYMAEQSDWFAGISGSYAAKVGMELFRDADLVIGVGASLNRFTLENGYLYPDAQFIQLDVRPSLLMYGDRMADCYVQTDAKVGVEKIAAALAAHNHSNPGYHTPEVKAQLATRTDDTMEIALDPGTVDPREVVRVLDELVPREIGVIVGTGSQSGFSQQGLKRERPLSGGGLFFACVGQGLPAAMGAVVAGDSQKPVLLIDGEGAFMMHLAEFETAVRYKMPLLVAVMNNEALGAEYYKLDAKGMDASTSVISCPDLGQVAVSLGGQGAIVRDIADLRRAVQAWVAKPDVPMVLDCRISRSICSLNYRRTYYGMDV